METLIAAGWRSVHNFDGITYTRDRLLASNGRDGTARTGYLRVYLSGSGTSTRLCRIMYFNVDETETDPTVAITRLWGQSKVMDSAESITTYNNGHPLLVLNQFMYIWASEDYCYYATQYSNITTASTLIGRFNNPITPKFLQPMTCSEDPPTIDSVWTVPDVTVLQEGMILEYTNTNGDPVGLIVPTQIQRDPNINGGKGGSFRFPKTPQRVYSNRGTGTEYLLKADVDEWVVMLVSTTVTDLRYVTTGQDLYNSYSSGTRLKVFRATSTAASGFLPRFEALIARRYTTMPVMMFLDGYYSNTISPNHTSTDSPLSVSSHLFQHLNTPELQTINSIAPPGALLVRKPTNQNKTTYSVGSATATTVTIPGADWTPNAFQNLLIYISTGMGANQARRIVSNTNNTIVVSQPFETIPNTTSIYQICDAAYRALMTISSPYRIIVREEPI